LHGTGGRGTSFHAGRTEKNAVSAHRASDILDLLLAHILEKEVEFVAHLIADDAARADAAGRGQGFKTGGDVDAVTKDIAVVDDDIAEIDTHAKLDPLVRRHAGVADGHFALHLDRTTHRVDDAGEFDQEAVTCRLDDPAPVFGDLWV